MEFISGTNIHLTVKDQSMWFSVLTNILGETISQQRKGIWQDLTSIEGKFLSLIKGIDEKPKANMSNGERLKAFQCLVFLWHGGKLKKHFTPWLVQGGTVICFTLFCDMKLLNVILW